MSRYISHAKEIIKADKFLRQRYAWAHIHDEKLGLDIENVSSKTVSLSHSFKEKNLKKDDSSNLVSTKVSDISEEKLQPYDIVHMNGSVISDSPVVSVYFFSCRGIILSNGVLMSASHILPDANPNFVLEEMLSQFDLNHQHISGFYLENERQWETSLQDCFSKYSILDKGSYSWNPGSFSNGLNHINIATNPASDEITIHERDEISVFSLKK